MEYAHEELMQELGITKTDLPKHLSVKIGVWSNKKRLSSSEEKKAQLAIESENIADEVTAWHYANGGEDDDEEEEDGTPEPIVKPVVVVDPISPIVPPTPATPPIVPPVAEEEKNNGWGLGFLNY
jgi:hypothetical protein